MPVKLNSSGGGSVTFDVPSTASDFTATMPANTGTVITTGSSGAVTASMLSTGAPSWTSGGNLSFNSGYGSAATAYGCRAWVNFNGTSTVSISASGNVTSITDNGTGDYTVNFTNAMPDAKYSVVVSGSNGGGDSLIAYVANGQTAPTSSAVRIRYLNAGFVLNDGNFQSVAIFR